MKVLSFLFAISVIASCAPSLNYYTKDLHEDSRWSDSELSKIQFYLSGDIVLWKDINRGESVISNGKIKVVDGKDVEEVIIKKGTPGVFLFSTQKNHFAISFDNVDDNKYLVFGPSEKVNGRYVLLAKDWDRRYGKVTYGGKTYKTTNESAFVYLMVDLDKTRNTKFKTTKASGRKVE
jgi:hypothetical protein